MDAFPAELDIDGATDAIATHIEQLVRNNGDLDKKTYIYNLQRKIRSLKEQLANKVITFYLVVYKLINYYICCFY